MLHPKPPVHLPGSSLLAAREHDPPAPHHRRARFFALRLSIRSPPAVPYPSGIEEKPLFFSGSVFRDNPRIKTKKDRKSTRLNSSHVAISYAVFCLKKKR